MKCSMDSLKFVCHWKGSIQGAKVCVRIGGLQIEGCTFNGSQLTENQRDSPTVSATPVCTVAWIGKVCVHKYYLIVFGFFPCNIAREKHSGYSISKNTNIVKR